MLTQERLKELVHYNPDTGVFTYRQQTNPRALVGQVIGSVQRSGHLRMQLDKKSYQLHQLAFLYMQGILPNEVDHRNNIPDDNRWDNLRVATHQQNCFNSSMRKDNTSGHKGISIRKNIHSTTYHARITLNGKETGKHFNTLDEALAWRNSKSIELHGSFAFNGINK